MWNAQSAVRSDLAANPAELTLSVSQFGRWSQGARARRPANLHHNNSPRPKVTYRHSYGLVVATKVVLLANSSSLFVLDAASAMVLNCCGLRRSQLRACLSPSPWGPPCAENREQKSSLKRHRYDRFTNLTVLLYRDSTYATTLQNVDICFISALSQMSMVRGIRCEIGTLP